MLFIKLVIFEFNFLILIIHLKVDPSFLVTKIVEGKYGKRPVKFLVVPDDSILTSPDVSIFPRFLERIHSEYGHTGKLP